MSLRHTIIRDLVYEYQVNKDAVVFSKLLQRCDGLLFATIYKHIRRRRLQNIDARDLYHTAIVGLGRAALTSPQNETAEKFTARIVAYVRLELDNDYYDKHRPGPSHFVSIDFQEEQPYFDDVTTKIDFEMLYLSSYTVPSIIYPCKIHISCDTCEKICGSNIY